MAVLRNGKFSEVFRTSDLVKGISKDQHQSRNQKTFSTLTGMIGFNGGLTSLPDLSQLDTSTLTATFPYPQLFIFSKVIVVCTEDKIYEFDGTSLTEVLTVTAGITWRAMDFIDFIVLSNNEATVVWTERSQSFVVSNDLPLFHGAMNYNGQMIICSTASSVTS